MADSVDSKQEEPPHAESVSAAVASTGFSYRPDVDGLRSVAVGLVLLYHAGLGWLGGFIGVDIFFVISGFLITGVILSREDQGKFTFKDFWARRFRRLAPTLMVVVIGCLIAGAFILWPDDYVSLAESSIAQQLFVANVYFWQNTGYFEGSADMMPLLHTWSLAVEEQFYFFYPFLLILFYRTRLRKTLVWALAVCVVLSLGLSIYGTRHFPSPTFYLLPTRAWELGLGGLLYFAMRKPLPRGLSELLAWAGLAAVLYCGWFYTSAMPFPGLAALWPCLATLAIIAGCASPGVSLSRLLALKPVVLVGQMSYALYLVHWPLLVFTRHIYGEVTPMAGVVCLVASFVLSYLIWVLIETPIRHRRLLAGTRPFVVASTAMILISVVGSVAIVLAGGFMNRYAPQAVAFLQAADKESYQHITSLDEILEDRVPVIGDEAGDIKAVLWGDSHAMAMLPGIEAACKEQGVRCYRITRDATPPMLDYPFSEEAFHQDTAAYSEAAFNWVLASDAEVVLIVGHWSWYTQRSDYSEQLKATVDRLVESGKRVVLVRSVPIQHGEVPKMLAQAVIDGEDPETVGVEVNYHRDYQAAADKALLPLASEHVVVLDPAVPLLNESGMLLRAAIDNDAMYVDQGHLSSKGALKMSPLFSNYFAAHKQISPEPPLPTY